MAENTIERKFFLDWEGVKTLWSKINSTFANKAAVDDSIGTLTSNINTVAGNLQALDTNVNARIDGVDGLIDTFMPREFPTYTDAVKGANMLAPGTVVKVEEDGPLLDDAGESIPDESGVVPIYKAGFYMVLDPENGVIEKVSTASGTGTGGNIEELAASLEQLNSEVVKGAIVVDESGNTLSTVEKSGNNLLIKVDNEFKVDSQSLNALTHRAIAAMFGTLSEQITQIPKFKISVVDKLPEFDISTSTIYLLKNSDVSSNNLYTEYIYVSSGNSGEWEKLGEQSLVIEDFAKKTDVERMINAALADVVKQGDLTTALATTKGEILTEIEDKYITKLDVEKFIDQDELNSALTPYYTKDDADAKFLTQAIADTMYVKNSDIGDFMTETEIIASIQEGTIGEVIRISDDQINSLTTE
jgi:hypothetical protein